MAGRGSPPSPPPRAPHWPHWPRSLEPHAKALARERLDVVVGGHARLGPAPPLDGVAAAQLVDEGVGRAVGGLADDAQLGAGGGEAHEARAAAVALAQVQCAGDLVRVRVRVSVRARVSVRSRF